MKSADLRGNLVFYEIVYYGLSEEQCPAKTYGSTGNTNISVTGEDPYAVIANLESENGCILYVTRVLALPWSNDK